MNAQIPVLLALSVADHDIDRCVAAARRAEEAGVDAIVLGEDPGTGAEPAVVLARIAAVTERIGLIGTFAAGYNDSLELARRLADLDHLSGGRVGWRVATDTSRRRYFGSRQPVTAAGQEIRDAAVVGSVVERWSLRTELRSPQGVPVVVADGNARFAAEFADVVLVDEPVERALPLRSGIHARASALGRISGSVRLIPRIRVADDIGRWIESGSAEGLLLQPASVDEFFDHLGPDLRRHGLLGSGGVTLRDRLGLPGGLIPAPIPTSAPVISLVAVR